jgi:hypothetical protein
MQMLSKLILEHLFSSLFQTKYFQDFSRSLKANLIHTSTHSGYHSVLLIVTDETDF